MQISKYLLAAGIFVAGLSPVLAQSDVDDAEERARAREQLNQKMAELEAQLSSGDQPMPPIAPADTEEMTPVPAPAPTPVIRPVDVETMPVIPPPVQPIPAQPIVRQPVPPPMPPIQPGGDEALARAREENRRKIAEMNGTSGTTTVRPTARPNPQPAPPPVAQKAPSQPKAAAPVRQSVVFQDSINTSDSDAIARARAETRRKIAELNGQSRSTTMAPAPSRAPMPAAPIGSTGGDSFTTGAAVQSYSPPPVQPPAQPATGDSRQQAETQAMKAASVTKAPAAPTAMSLIQAPAPAISAAKQIHLNELLNRYKTDKITPEEYHAERARILAEP